MKELMAKRKYTYEDICESCAFARWHWCEDCYPNTDKKFCHCVKHKASGTILNSGACSFKRLRTKGKLKDENLYS